jgi:flagellar protein FlaF
VIVRENVANLAVFVFKRTMEIESAPAPEKLAALIEINRNLAAGLRGRA